MACLKPISYVTILLTIVINVVHLIVLYGKKSAGEISNQSLFCKLPVKLFCVEGQKQCGNILTTSLVPPTTDDRLKPQHSISRSGNIASILDKSEYHQSFFKNLRCFTSTAIEKKCNCRGTKIGGHSRDSICLQC